MFKNTLIALLFGCLIYLLYIETEFKRAPKLLGADAVLPDGSTYHGEMKNGLFHGLGELSWRNGNVIVGQFNEGLAHGEGEFWGADGTTYIGEFKEGMFNGKGKITFGDGSEYEGEFADNMFNGIGTLKTKGGERYDGNFKNNLFSGQGRYEAHGSIYTGEFENGEILRGVYLDSHGNQYEGKFSNWSFNGEGTYTTTDGGIYTGTFTDGILEGEAKFKDADGTNYTGSFENFYYSGEGVLTLANGDRYQGEFDFGQYHGQGELTLAKEDRGHTQLKGEWEYGRLKKDPRRIQVDYSDKIETALYTQNTLLQKAFKQVETGVEGASELYFLALAGYGKQDVFLKEVNALTEFFDTPEYAKGRILNLVNNFTTIDEKPLATVNALAMSLNEIEKKMNIDEDILFLYLTSHGSAEHEFNIQLSGLNLPDIPAKKLADVLNQTKIKWKVIFISACYSGGFIPLLENENTLIITAARHDRKSFGCGDLSEITYFAKAYFQEALPKSEDFISAFALAEQVVTKWEDEDFPDSEHSVPQISVGAGIEHQLHVWKNQE